MKRNMKAIYCLTALFTGMTFFGCESDNDPDGGESGKEKAWVSFSISLPKTGGTKAADPNDANAEAVETEVKTVDVWLQNAGTATGYTKIALNKTLFPGTGSTYIAQAVKVDGTAGDANRNLFVAINAPASYDPNVDLAADKIHKMGNLTDIQRLYSTTDGFVMFNTAEVKAKLYATDTEANANLTVVNVERTAGKAMLRYDEAKLFGSGDQVDQSGGGKFKAGTLKWQVRNANNKYFLIKNTTYEDPNYTFTSGSSNDFGDNYIKEPYSTWLDVPTKALAPATGYDAAGDAFVQYFPENTNAIYVEGNTTHLSVQVAFVPKELVTDYTKPNEPTDNSAAAAATFYYNKVGKKYYSKTAYDAAVLADQTTKKDFWGPYENGICYYYVPVGTGDLSTPDLLGAKRNHFYKMTINSMTAPGNPTPGTVDPEVNPENPVIKTKVWIAVKIEVEDWTVADAQVELK